MLKTSLQKIYSDIDFTFARQPGKTAKDLALSYDDKAVIRSVRNLLLTKHYDRLFNPNLGSNISFILFEPLTGSTAATLESEIRNTINNFEPRVEIDSITVGIDEDRNGYNVTLSFYILNATAATVTTLFLERTK